MNVKTRYSNNNDKTVRSLGYSVPKIKPRMNQP